MNLHTPKISEFSSIIAKDNKVRNILKIFKLNFLLRIKIAVLRAEIYQQKYCQILI